MNAPIRHVALVMFGMIFTVMLSTTWIQFFQSETLADDSRNARATYREYNRARGAIVVDGVAIAKSTPVNDPYGYQRSYTDGELYSPVTGFFSVVNGMTEIEKSENAYLNGTADDLVFHRVRSLLTGEKPQGSSVVLTIDPKVQQAAWDALGDQRGAAVAIEPQTGRILALVSKPSFDPNLLATHDRSDANAAFQELNAASDEPMQNRAIRGKTYPPGSTFKLVTAAAALESGQYTAESIIPAPDSYTLPGTSTNLPNFGNSSCSSTQEMTLHDALRISCNTAFAALGVTLGDDALRAQSQDFHFDQKLSVPMTVTPSRFPEDPNAPMTALAAIGQGDVRVTPLEVAMITAGIANNGVVMKPYTVDRVLGSNLVDVITQTRPTELTTAISPETAQQLTTMMVSVVESGSGQAAAIPGISVAGKTGTAQDPSAQASHAWFTGFAPADNPQVAVAVLIESGGSLGAEATGGKIAAPVVKAIMEAVIRP